MRSPPTWQRPRPEEADMIIIAGTFRLQPEDVEGATPALIEMMAETAKEDGCAAYVFSPDMSEPGLFNLFEEWETMEHLQAHFVAPHMAIFQAKLAELENVERNIFKYEASGQGPAPITHMRINMWSSPRNLSTAMLYSWAQRADTTAVDEPIYAHYLRVTGRGHPGDDEVLASQDNDGESVIRDVMLAEYDTPIVFFKQMAKHLVELDWGFLSQFRNVLLTREPHDMLTSLQVRLPDTTLDDTGFPELVAIVDWLVDAGEEPIVVDTKFLLQDPHRVLGELCDRLGVPFDDAMLSWPAGPKEVDGVWAKHWYTDGVHKSTGWAKYVPKDAELLPAVAPVLEEALPLYERPPPTHHHPLTTLTLRAISSEEFGGFNYAVWCHGWWDWFSSGV